MVDLPVCIFCRGTSNPCYCREPASSWKTVILGLEETGLGELGLESEWDLPALAAGFSSAGWVFPRLMLVDDE